MARLTLTKEVLKFLQDQDNVRIVTDGYHLDAAIEINGNQIDLGTFWDADLSPSDTAPNWTHQSNPLTIESLKKEGD